MKGKYENMKVIYLASFNNQRSFAIYNQENHLENIFSIPNLSLPLDSFNVPYLFTINNSLLPSPVLFPDSGFPEMIDDYFTFINNQYFD
jgi:hypothetical protein